VAMKLFYWKEYDKNTLDIEMLHIFCCTATGILSLTCVVIRRAGKDQLWYEIS